MLLRTLCTMALGVALTSSAAAQQAQDRARAGQDDQRMDQQIASAIILANLTQKELSKIAKDKVDNEDVEEFAKKMRDEHKEIVSKFERFAPHAANVKLTEDDDKDRARSPRGRQATQAGQDQADRKLFTVQRRAAEKAVKLSKEEMEELDSEELAKAYVGQQIAAQINLLAALTAAERSASGDLKDAIQDAKSRTEDNLSEAKEKRRELREES